MSVNIVSIANQVSLLRAFLKNDEEKRSCKTASKRRNLIEEIYSLTPSKKIYKKFFKNCKNPSSQCSKQVKRICKYAGLDLFVSPKLIRKCAKGECGKHFFWTKECQYSLRNNMVRSFFEKFSELNKKKQKYFIQLYGHVPVELLHQELYFKSL